MQTKPLFQTMVAKGLAASNSFGIWLSADPAAEPAGEISLGGPDPSRYAGRMRHAPVIGLHRCGEALERAVHDLVHRLRVELLAHGGGAGHVD
jgi:hypothetical protein